MSFWDWLRPLERKSWFLCYACLMQTDHDAAKSIFHSPGPPTPVMGRPVFPCPRCESHNTVSFQQLQDEGAKAQLFGLERIVRKNPRSMFMIKPAEAKSVPQG